MTSAGRSLRIGLVCPYSLTVPGGVQAQVLGLARELRRQGHEARVLGPCDGPPPEPFVTPLGNSLPTAANGSIAPLAPDASAALRTIRALHDEEFDVLHVHEPLAPGPPMTSVLMHPAPTRRHVPRRRANLELPDPPADRCGGWPAASTARSWCPRTPLELVQRSLGGDYDILFNGVEDRPIAATAADADDGPTIFFCGRHEERKGLAVLLEAFAELPATTRLWIASDGPDGPRAAGRVRRRQADHVARADQRRREVRPPARGDGVLRARRCTASRSASC